MATLRGVQLPTLAAVPSNPSHASHARPAQSQAADPSLVGRLWVGYRDRTHSNRGWENGVV